MAVIVDIKDERFGNIKNAYCKLIHLHGNTEKIYYSMQIYKDKDISDYDTKDKKHGRLKDLHIKVINDSFDVDLLAKGNVFEQCYNDFKTKYSNIVKSDVKE